MARWCVWSHLAGGGLGWFALADGGSEGLMFVLLSVVLIESEGKGSPDWLAERQRSRRMVVARKWRSDAAGRIAGGCVLVDAG